MTYRGSWAVAICFPSASWTRISRKAAIPSPTPFSGREQTTATSRGTLPGLSGTTAKGSERFVSASFSQVGAAGGLPPWPDCPGSSQSGSSPDPAQPSAFGGEIVAPPSASTPPSNSDPDQRKIRTMTHLTRRPSQHPSRELPARSRGFRRAPEGHRRAPEGHRRRPPGLPRASKAIFLMPDGSFREPGAPRRPRMA